MYREHISRGILPRGSRETYAMSTTDFLPAIAVFTIDIETGEFSPSSSANWNFNWSQSNYSDGEFHETPIDSIECWMLIDSFTELSEADRQAMKDELSEDVSCPNTTHIDLSVARTIGVSAGFKLDVEPSHYGKEQGVMDKYNVMVSTAITRYFDPEEFDEQGFMTPF